MEHLLLPFKKVISLPLLSLFRVINGDTIRPNTTAATTGGDLRKYSNVIHQSLENPDVISSQNSRTWDVKSSKLASSAVIPVWEGRSQRVLNCASRPTATAPSYSNKNKKTGRTSVASGEGEQCHATKTTNGVTIKSSVHCLNGETPTTISPRQARKNYRVAFAKSYSAYLEGENLKATVNNKHKKKQGGRHRRASEPSRSRSVNSNLSNSNGRVTATPQPPQNPEPILPKTIDATTPIDRVSSGPQSTTFTTTASKKDLVSSTTSGGKGGASSLSNDTTGHVTLDSVKLKSLLSSDQLVMRDSVEKVQKWMESLPPHFDTIYHVLPPAKRDY